MAWLGSTCTIFTRRWTTSSEFKPCRAPQYGVVSGQAHVLSAFKGIYDRAASVSDERASAGLLVHRLLHRVNPAGALTALEVYTSTGPASRG